MTLNSDETGDDQRPQPSHPSTSTGKVGITVGVLVLSGLGVLANMAQVIDLFSHSWVIIVVVLGICVALAGALLLERQWRKPLGAVALAAIALLMVGSVATTTAVVYSARPAQAVVDPPPPPGPSTSASTSVVPNPGQPTQTVPRQLEIVEPKMGAVVKWNDVVTATGTSMGPGQRVVLFLKPLPGNSIWPSPCGDYEAADRRVRCDVRYGDENVNRGLPFDVSVVVVNEKDYSLLSEYHANGKKFGPDKVPVRVLVESERIRVTREK